MSLPTLALKKKAHCVAFFSHAHLSFPAPTHIKSPTLNLPHLTFAIDSSNTALTTTPISTPLALTMCFHATVTPPFYWCKRCIFILQDPGPCPTAHAPSSCHPKHWFPLAQRTDCTELLSALMRKGCKARRSRVPSKYAEFNGPDHLHI